MRVCLVGHFSGQPDNRGDLGVKQVGLEIAKKLRERHETIVVDIKRPLSWTEVRSFQPEILHFVLGPSLTGLLAAKAVAQCWRRARTVMSAPNPDIISPRLGALLKPDLVLVQSCESETMFRAMGCPTQFLPNGVDVERFRPADAQRKLELRDKFSVPRDCFVILHVGPIVKPRNVDSLAELQTAGQQVVVVGRMAPLDNDVCHLLTDKGCMVITQYVEHIEEIYALSDCYVFPTPPANKQASIEVPLSVLEAMSCNLPVITTRFGALPTTFEKGQGLVLFDSERGLRPELSRARNHPEVRTRDKVLPYSWGSIRERLDAIYQRLLTSR